MSCSLCVNVKKVIFEKKKNGVLTADMDRITSVRYFG